MPDKTNVVELPARDERRKRIERFSDVELVQMMLGMHSPTTWGTPMLGGATETGATLTRTLFIEVCARWVPPDVFGVAFRAHMAALDEPDTIPALDEIEAELASIKEEIGTTDPWHLSERLDKVQYQLGLWKGRDDA